MPESYTVKDMLSGRREAVEQLARSSHEAWIPLIEHLLDQPALAPALVASLWSVKPDVPAWLHAIDQALRSTEKIATAWKGRKILFPWLRDSVLAAFPDSHEAAVEVRIEDLRTVARDDGGFADARRLHAQLVEQVAGDGRLAEVALLVAKGALTERDYEAARRYATMAVESSCSSRAETCKPSLSSRRSSMPSWHSGVSALPSGWSDTI